MSSPYIDTELCTSVTLLPMQMNNSIYLNLKENLRRKLKGKCFLNHGYISEIYAITQYGDGIMQAESLNGDAVYDIKFSCRVCIPIVGYQIICQVDKAHKLLIAASNGPIIAIITTDRINREIFYTDTNNNIQYKDEKKASKMLSEKDIIVVTVQNIIFHDGDDKIKTVVFLDNVATEEQIAQYYKDLYGSKRVETTT